MRRFADAIGQPLIRRNIPAWSTAPHRNAALPLVARSDSAACAQGCRILRSSGYQERRAAMLTVVVQEYIVDMRPCSEHASNEGLAR